MFDIYWKHIMVVIRLSRGGSKKRPYYKIVASNSRAPRDGKYLDGSKSADVELYKALGPVGRELGLRWGGDFKSITDLPHYEHMSWQNRKR
mgnify:CR=1 FL=1